jgi:hypothetical protein
VPKEKTVNILFTEVIENALDE